MKLSFSTNHWSGYTMADYFEFAADYKFNGFEMHGVSEMDEADVKNVYHKLYDYKIKISCIDMASDISTEGERAYEELTKCIRVAKALGVPYVRLKASEEEGVREFFEKALVLAEESNTTSPDTALSFAFFTASS